MCFSLFSSSYLALDSSVFSTPIEGCGDENMQGSEKLHFNQVSSWASFVCFHVWFYRESLKEMFAATRLQCKVTYRDTIGFYFYFT